ncbi:type II toxin-antitoxin system HicB family antitoxin [Pelatocladus sp. BLCC-F211]|uniref:type II toxin-antitoxin system HicB family antitoxin n=1 Tax=Pelatocladus sp. BLCC-F211 TaxID=3342752 RepID=UPI0035BABEAC
MIGKENLASVFINSLAVTSLHKLSLHVLVEQAESGHFIASVPELPDCTVEAETRDTAIASLQEQVKARLANMEVLTLEVANNPWTDFIGMCLREMKSLRIWLRNYVMSVSWI